MTNVNLVLSLPHGIITATSLGVEGLAWHLSPGTSRKFHGRAVLVDLELSGGYAAFSFLDEGGWREADLDARQALDAVRTGKRTKTALSNTAFNCTPLSAYAHVYLAKSSGAILEMEPVVSLIRFKGHANAENLKPNQVAAVAGLPEQNERLPRLYLVINPVQMVVLSSLTPEEYVWYATHRSGKVFRQMLFAELTQNTSDLAAREIFETNYQELLESPEKKTKTIIQGSGFSKVPYSGWKGYGAGVEGGLYGGDRDAVYFWRFPNDIARSWEKAN